MRINAVAVHNFRGIRRAEISGLADQPLVTVSGRNGSGKSLLLEAMGLLWRADRLQVQFFPQFLLGSWGDQLTIEMEITLVASERAALEASAHLVGLAPPAPERSTLRLVLRRADDDPLSVAVASAATAQPMRGEFSGDPWRRLLRLPSLFLAHSFGQLDHLPADRNVGRGEQPQVNPALLSEEQRENLRNQIIGSYAQQRQVVGITGISPLLATADYMDLLAEREQQPPSGDFDAITGPFFAATGKRIDRPSRDPASPFGASLPVRTASGTTHSLDQLSSGEQEVLSLAFFVRRLRARGGVLLIDEPELHLHPALQRSLFTQLEEVAERGQVWIVTHSPRLVTVASLPAVLHMRAPQVQDENQLRRASDEEDRDALLADLGIHPIEVLQSQFLVVVEGQTDEQRLGGLLPIDLSPAVVSIAGGAREVEQTCRSLRSAAGLRFVGIRDRDLLSDDEVAERVREIPELFIWPRRSLENELLDSRLLAKTLTRAGARTSPEQVADQLLELAQRQREVILADLVRQRLANRHALDVQGGSRLERLRSYIEETVRLGAEKLAEFNETVMEVRAELDARWEADYLTLMDGKRALREYTEFAPLKSPASLMTAIIATLRDHPELVPPGIATLQARIQRLALETRVEPAAGQTEDA